MSWKHRRVEKDISDSEGQVFHQEQSDKGRTVVLRDLDRIMGRWKGAFDKMLNGENYRFVFEDGVPDDGLTQGIGRNEVRVTLSQMKKGETMEMDGIPEDVRMCLGEEVIDMLSI